jgi:hypothetical protein
MLHGQPTRATWTPHTCYFRGCCITNSLIFIIVDYLMELILLGEESGPQQLNATFSNEVVEEIILLYSLER